MSQKFPLLIILFLKIDVCISQVERANTKLENIVWKLDSFEKEITKLTGIKPVVSVPIYA